MRRCLIAMITLLTAACAVATPEPRGLTETFAGQARPDPALRRQVIIESQAYWNDIARGDWRGAYDRFTDDYRADTPFETWRRQRHDAWARPPLVTGIRWTKAAHHFHGPELYAIVAWTARRGSAGSEGTLTWRQGPDGRFRLENTVVRVLIPPRR